MLKLGTRTGSLKNHVMSRVVRIEPEVGMGATVLAWTDRYACTIVDIFTYRGRLQMALREDTATLTDGNGMSDSQCYDYEPNPSGRVFMFSKRADGDWAELGVRNGRGYGLLIGYRQANHDYSF